MKAFALVSQRLLDGAQNLSDSDTQVGVQAHEELLEAIQARGG